VKRATGSPLAFPPPPSSFHYCKTLSNVDRVVGDQGLCQNCLMKYDHLGENNLEARVNKDGDFSNVFSLFFKNIF